MLGYGDSSLRVEIRPDFEDGKLPIFLLDAAACSP